MKHVRDTTIHTIFPVLLSMARLVQNDISAPATPSNASTPTIAKRRANIATQIKKNNLCLIVIYLGTLHFREYVPVMRFLCLMFLRLPLFFVLEGRFHLDYLLYWFVTAALSAENELDGIR